jgi:DEAD/DEAH box helicase domain-containing protein
LRTGKLLAVVSTSALELGIDIGDLDICILVGYPGSMMATRQRGGRVGRKGQDAAVLFIAGQDALDQYYIRHPEAFFEGRPESVVVNPYNPVILKDHLICAAAELPLHRDEAWLNPEPVQTAVDDLIDTGDLLATADGSYFHSRAKQPHRNVDLRGAGKRYRIIHNTTLLGEINDHRLYFETHPGAIYMHQGRTYLVTSIERDNRTVNAEPANPAFYTRTRNETDVRILNLMESKYTNNTKYYYGKLKVTDQVLGYERIGTDNGRNLGYHELDVPPATFETEGLWCLIDETVCRYVQDQGCHLLGALHAAEHAAIGIMPLLVLADRNDVGGLATPMHPQTHGTTIFIYDGIPGGGGLTRMAFEHIDRLFTTARDTIDACDCDDGCPACVHSPKCGSGNQPMDKQGGALLLREIATGGSPIRIETSKAPCNKPAPTIEQDARKPLRYGVFDLETQRSAQEVGGWHMAHAMKISCGVVYDAGDDTFAVYLEDRIDRLVEHLRQLDLVIGFNIMRFDYHVLKGYSNFDFSSLNTLDLLEMVHDQLGFRISLDHLAGQTLNAAKSGSGLDALKWWKEGRIDKIIDYCRQDVMLTRDLYLHARDYGYLVYQNRRGERFRIPVSASRLPSTPHSPG